MITEDVRRIAETDKRILKTVLHRTLYKTSGESRNIRTATIIFIAGVAIGAAASEHISNGVSRVAGEVLGIGEDVIDYTRRRIKSRSPETKI